MNDVNINPDVMEVGTKLVAMCKQGQHMEAINELYADDVVSLEVCSMPEMPARVEGKDAVIKKGEQFFATTEMHGGNCEGPFPNGDQFAAIFTMDCTPKEGPMAGQRMEMKEIALYTVKDGKITEERFYYTMG